MPLHKGYLVAALFLEVLHLVHRLSCFTYVKRLCAGGGWSGLAVQAGGLVVGAAYSIKYTIVNTQ